MNFKIPDFIKGIDAYVAGKPIEELEREYGITGSIKLASNENPLGPSPKGAAAAAAVLKNLHRYPDDAGFELMHKLAAFLKLPPDRIVLGNGSDDLLSMLTRALLEPGDEVLIPEPSFLVYRIVAKSCGARPIAVPLKGMEIDLPALAGNITPRTRIIFVCNPNNPTGSVVTEEAFADFINAVPGNVVVVMDEAYIHFVRDPRCAQGLSWLNKAANVVVLRTFSKAYGLAGLRVGYGVMDSGLARILHRVRMPFNVNLPAQAAAAAALDDADFLNKTIALVHDGLDFLYAQLDQRGVTYFPSQTNFFLIDMGRSAKSAFQSFLRQGVIVRPMDGYGFPNFIRISVGLPAENERFLKALDRLLANKE